MSVLRSLKKSRKLWKVSKKLAGPSNLKFDVKSLMKNQYQSSKALEELIDIAYSDKYVHEIIKKNNLDRETLKNIYDQLVFAGAGQYVKGHFVAASSIVYPQSLNYILENYDGQKFKIEGLSDKDAGMQVAYRLIKYFE